MNRYSRGSPRARQSAFACPAVWVKLQRTFTLLVCPARLLAAAAWLWRTPDRDPDVAFLPSHSPGEWNVCPKQRIPICRPLWIAVNFSPLLLSLSGPGTDRKLLFDARMY